ncbi:hypothetical protein [Pectobacterium versatile]|uniref:Uncharacterized protein n=1 Tax=Pectobacterium versatile TaxID=2488639 RepID=A0A855MBJ6_9GAMM|nr:hypothetical protein [Pectobacterium versatile]MBN3196627.1 hypothetical protein [Pectobacterium versatile]MBQ4788856.1 hypothetical protein [Pectobacterium versatile]POY48143.1 hypothetical protein F131LOC_04127 [Pectobacterium versatile]QPK16195.1 hypothetical protein F131LOC_001985 [Pectobacterium versatile]TAI95959.1 hypothetical protein EG335_14110 [Pectobacterium versatile]
MKKFKSLDDVAQILGDGGACNPDIEFKTVGELVDALVDLGNTDKIFVRHDDHLGLKDKLSDDFLNSSLSVIDNTKFESAIEAVLDQANTIIPLFKRELSEDDLEEIKEDKMYRGENIDD